MYNPTSFSNAFKISVRFGHMQELLGEAFFAAIAALLLQKITKPSSSGNREKRQLLRTRYLGLAGFAH